MTRLQALASVVTVAAAETAATSRGRRCGTRVSWDPRDTPRVSTAYTTLPGIPSTCIDHRVRSRPSTKQTPALVAPGATRLVTSRTTGRNSHTRKRDSNPPRSAYLNHSLRGYGSGTRCAAGRGLVRSITVACLRFKK